MIKIKSNTLTFYVNWFQITHQDAEQYGFKLKNKDGTGAPIEAAYEVSKDSMQLHVHCLQHCEHLLKFGEYAFIHLC